MTQLAARPSHTKHATSKRKGAFAGPAHKAKVTRQRRGAKGGTDSAGRTQAMLQALASGGPLSALGTEAANLGMAGGKKKKGEFGGHHRHQNPANVKALNRSLRRVEGFEKLVKRVMHHKLFKRVRGGSAGMYEGRARGHKSGCGCAVCRRGK